MASAGNELEMRNHVSLSDRTRTIMALPVFSRAWVGHVAKPGGVHPVYRTRVGIAVCSVFIVSKL